MDSSIAKHRGLFIHGLVRRKQVLTREPPDAVDVKIEGLLGVLAIAFELAERPGVENGVEEKIDEIIVDQWVASCCHAFWLPRFGQT
jgi:hypothetical protein